MQCPILHMTWMMTKVGDKGQSLPCLKEECAWWDAVKKQCCIKTLSELETFSGVRTLGTGNA